MNIEIDMRGRTSIGEWVGTIVTTGLFFLVVSVVIIAHNNEIAQIQHIHKMGQCVIHGMQTIVTALTSIFYY